MRAMLSLTPMFAPPPHLQPTPWTPLPHVASRTTTALARPVSRWTWRLLGALALLSGLSACGLTAPAAPATGAAAAPALITGGSPHAGTDIAQSAPLHLRLLAFNDLHGHLQADHQSLRIADPDQPTQSYSVAAGGADALAGLAKALRAQVPHSLLISSGDMVGAAPLVSTLFRHESTIVAMNATGVDVGIPGNHEFDGGVAELQRLMHGGCAAPKAPFNSCPDGRFPGTNFPLVAANVTDSHTGQTLIAPSTVFNIDGVKIGVIGAVTRSTPQSVVPSGVAGLRFEDEAAAINRAAAALQTQGVHTLVAVIHEGGELDTAHEADWNDTSCPGAHGALFELNRRITPAVDVVFSAHTHQGYRCLVEGRPVLQAFSYGRGLSVVDLTIDRRSGDVLREHTQSRNLPVLNGDTSDAQRRRVLQATPAPWRAALASATADAIVAQIVSHYADLAGPQADRPVGRIRGTFVRDDGPDSVAGRLIADAQLAAAQPPSAGGAQIALTNQGGIRSDLRCASGRPPCDISFGQAFTMQPFGNTVVVLTLTGQQLHDILEAQQRGQGDQRHWLQPSRGLSYRWVSGAPAGQRVQDLQLHGRPIEPSQNVRVAVNSYLAEGGSGFATFKEGQDRRVGESDLQALVDYLATQPAPDHRPRVYLRRTAGQ